MIAVGDDEKLYFLGFADWPDLDNVISKLQCAARAQIVQGSSSSIRSIEKELKAYFKGELKEFKTPLFMLGTLFQVRVWRELQKTSYGETRSYADIAKAIGKPTAFRAVAQANSINRFAIVVPCHRIINSDGKLGGYSSGLQRKEKLLELERRIK
jgi:AraC family transcriptional regulator of adaptative response/methylated-DNA-[protein]-cysteine methyltransferase